LQRIPGVSNKLAPRYDVWGEAMERYQYGGNSLFNVLINPAFVTRVKNNPAAMEVDRIWSISGDPRIVPKTVQRTVTVNNQKVQLTNEQISQYQQITGTLTLNAFTKLSASPKFAELNIATKAEYMAKIIEKAGDFAKFQLFATQPDLVQAVQEDIQTREAARAEALSGF